MSIVLIILTSLIVDDNIIFPSNLISEAIKRLDIGKSARPDVIYAEPIKFAHHRLRVLLCMCFSTCPTHGYMSANMIETTIVSILK